MSILVATHAEILVVDGDTGDVHVATGLEGRRPTDVAWDRWTDGRAWCGTARHGVLRSDDGGRTWRPAGLDGEHVMTVVPSRAERDVVWVGTEPSAVYRGNAGTGTRLGWRRVEGLQDLPSSPEWAFPPKPETNHVRWIAPHPGEAGRLWVAIEAGGLVMLRDGREWHDRVDDGPYDTHELAIHAERPETLRVAAGDGYYESADGGSTWSRPRAGLDVGYLRSVAIDPGDPDVVLISAASGPRTAYVAGRADGRVYRRVAQGNPGKERQGSDKGYAGSAWQRITDGWPAQPGTIAPILRAGRAQGELWAADERGVHRSGDGGLSWRQFAGLPSVPDHLRGLSIPS